MLMIVRSLVGAALLAFAVPGCAVSSAERTAAEADDLTFVHVDLAKVTSFQNYAGDWRYVRSSDRMVKLYMSASARDNDKPWDGYNEVNTFNESCGPDAVVNLFRWWGVEKLSGGTLTPQALGTAMHTNDWGFFGRFPGTGTSNLLSTLGSDFDNYCNAICQSQHHEIRVMTDEASPMILWQRLEWPLRGGSPVIVNYKTSWDEGHFALVIGLEKMAAGSDPSDNDLVYMANIAEADSGYHAMTWGAFHSRWRRDYAGPDQILSAAGESPFTAIWVGQNVSGGGGGGGGGGSGSGHGRVLQ
jgi:hypothetical protein